jgi:hypothetical protein
VVALGEQRITVYDAAGKMLQAPVSTGATGYETPAGVFSIVQKKEMHESNLYEDGKMPFMQRITWTGIALHAGVLPGRPASHGCVRMPPQFAEQLFPLTDLGMRVVIVRDDIAPAEISHPLLFRSKVPADPGPQGLTKQINGLEAIASQRTAEAAAALKRAIEAKRVAARKAAEAAAATRSVRMAEGSLAKAQGLLTGAERASEAAAAAAQTAPADKAGNQERNAAQAKERADKARAKLTEIEALLATLRAQAQAKADEAAHAVDDAKAAEAAKDAATDAADDAKRKTQPVSMFISRKTQRYYIRQGFQPVYEGPVTIQDPDRPIGTYVFTALRTSAADLRWSVVSMYKSGAAVQPVALGAQPAAPADVAGATEALDRIALPKDALGQIPDVVLPGSSLIISDEGPSIETGKDTDFIVVMSEEPQGALKARKREPLGKFGDDDFFARSPSGGIPFWSSNRSRYRGGFSFFD